MNFVEVLDLIADFFTVLISMFVLIALTVGWVKKCFTEDFDELSEASEQEENKDSNKTE